MKTLTSRSLNERVIWRPRAVPAHLLEHPDQALQPVGGDPAAEAVGDEHEVVVVEPRGEGRVVRRAELLLVRQALPVGAQRPAQRLPDRGLDPLAADAGIDQGIGRDVVDEDLERVVEARALVGVDRGVVEGVAVLGRLADRRPGQLVEQHLAIARRVGMARHGDLAERLAREGRALDRELLRLRGGHREPERLREVGAKAGAVARHVGADPVHHDDLEDRPLGARLSERRVARLAVEQRQDPAEGRAADLADAGVLAGLLRWRQQRPRDALAEAGAAGQQPGRGENQEQRTTSTTA